MTTEEALEVLKTIDESYPKFNLTTRKAKVLIPNLKKMNYKGVMTNLGDHVMNNIYPPTLSEIAVYEEERRDSALDEIKAWQEEARKVTPELKQRFRMELEKLYREKGWMD